MAATGVGSLPHEEVEAALDHVMATMGEIPFCPQLPSVSPLESMYHQGVSGLPGLEMEEGGRLWVNLTGEILHQMSSLDPTSDVRVIRSLVGLDELLRRDMPGAVALKGQLVGPVSLGLTLADQGRKPLLYSDDAAAGLAQILSWKMQWLEAALGSRGLSSIVFVDEPYLTTLGSGFFSYSESLVRDLIGLSLSHLRGTKGIHCCGKVDWSVILSLGVDIVSFDAHQHFSSLALFSDDLGRFMEEGGTLAWGIVPTDETEIREASAPALALRLEGFIEELKERGIPQDRLLTQALITPACGLASPGLTEAERALRLTADVSELVRRKHGLGPAAISR